MSFMPGIGVIKKQPFLIKRPFVEWLLIFKDNPLLLCQTDVASHRLIFFTTLVDDDLFCCQYLLTSIFVFSSSAFNLTNSLFIGNHHFDDNICISVVLTAYDQYAYQTILFLFGLLFMPISGTLSFP